MSQANNQMAQPGTQKSRFSVAITTENYKALIRNTLQDPNRARSFVASITSAVSATPALQNCEASSILACGLLGESLNLSPSPQLGQYYIIPFKQKAKVDRRTGELLSPETIKAQFVLGYKGYVQLALRSGYYKDLDVMEIHEGEYLGKDQTTGKPKFSFVEDDETREALPIVGYMAYFEYLNGFRKSIYWSKTKMMHHADTYSQAFSAKAYEQLQAGAISKADEWKYSSFWYKDFDNMAKKTLLRQLISKWGIMSTELQTAIDRDSQLMDFSGKTLIGDPEPVPALVPESEPMPVHADEEAPEGAGAQEDGQDAAEQVDLNAI